jgi:ribose 5-phosphate isomerase B
MRIALGADHAGFSLKEALKPMLDRRGISYEDFGTDSDAPVDYPDIASEVAREVASGRFDRAVLICGTGIGMAMSANKVHGIRAAMANTVELARLSRGHNDANVLALGGRILAPETAAEILETFLDTPFDGGRHQARINKIAALERAEDASSAGHAGA